MKFDKPITFRLHKKTTDRFKKEASKFNLPLGNYVRLYIEHMLKKHGVVKIYEGVDGGRNG